jgi:hypothetical protein
LLSTRNGFVKTVSTPQGDTLMVTVARTTCLTLTSVIPSKQSMNWTT